MVGSALWAARLMMTNSLLPPNRGRPDHAEFMTMLDDQLRRSEHGSLIHLQRLIC